LKNFSDDQYEFFEVCSSRHAIHCKLNQKRNNFSKKKFNSTIEIDYFNRQKMSNDINFRFI
jgi:hypothetical protein